MLREEVEFGVGTVMLHSELDGSVDLGVAGVGLIVDRAVGVRLGMLLLLEAEPAPEEFKYSIVTGNYVFQYFQYERTIPFS